MLKWYEHQPSPPSRANLSQLSILDTKTNDASLLGIQSTTEDLLWYPDNGATHHVAKDPTVYSTKQPYQGTKTVKMGNGSGLSIANIEYAFFHSFLTDKPLFFLQSFTCPFDNKKLTQFFLCLLECISNFMLTIVVLLINLRTKFFFTKFLRMVYTLF